MLHLRAFWGRLDGGKKKHAAVYVLKIFPVTLFPPDGGLVVTRRVTWNAAALDVGAHRRQLEMQSTHGYRRTFPSLFFSPPLLSNLGHILCGRLGHTTPLGFAGIWRTAGPSLNLNIWITGRCVNTPLCLTFPTFSLLKLSLRVLRLIFFFPHHLFIPSPAPHQWYAHPVHSHPILSGSILCHIHLKCAYTLN